MKIQFENVDSNSRSGPNGFGLKLARQLLKDGHELTNENPDTRLSFIQSINDFNPTVLRLDGIYFNSEQDWKRMNEPVRRSYEYANAVIVQSEFDKKLIFNFFGKRDNVHVVHNGTDVELIKDIPPRLDPPHETIWMCASSWRPHKRLDENIKLFQHLRGSCDKLVVAGKNAHVSNDIDVTDVHFLGDLTWAEMIGWMKSANHFIHLAWLDHCPNVVVDAKAAGCKLHVSQAGGTAELVSESDVTYSDAEFDFEPIRLYSPPSMDFLNAAPGTSIKSLSIGECSKKYIKILKSVI